MHKNNLKVVISAIICLCVVFNSTIVQADTSEPAAAVKAKAEMEKTIKDWIAKGYITKHKIENFKPEEAATKGEAAIVINRIFEYRGKAASNFADVKKGNEYYNDMLIAKKNGVFPCRKG